jgi:ubiquinone biosynthesis protein
MTLLTNLALLLVFAWLVRGALSARELTWRRTLAAVLIGSIAGALVAGLLLIDPAELRDPTTVEATTGELFALALPFQLIAMMVAVVAFELVSARPARRPTLRPVRPLKALRRQWGIARRMLEVSRILSRHGLAPALGLRRGEIDTRQPAELARRTRLALEDAGGMFVKLGQLLATRPDLLPAEALAELGRLHAAAQPLPGEVVRTAIATELPGRIDTVFTELDAEPIGSASIAQVHAARLLDGREVVVKLRRPRLDEVVERDLAITDRLARIAERRTTWGRTYGVRALADDFASALRGELDLRLEARNAQELGVALAADPGVHVPDIVGELTTEALLVMDRLPGHPLSALPHDTPEDVRRAIADELCASQVRAMLQGQRFHADPHPGNVMLLPDGTLGLIDLGATGKLDAFERASMLQLLVAIGLQEPTLLYEALVAVGAIAPERHPDEIERELARFMAAHLGTGLPPADALTELLRVTTRLGIRLPPQASTMFRALATLAGTLESVSPGYPLIDVVADLGGVELRERMSPSSVGEFVQHEWAQLGPLLRRAPRQLDRIATQLQHGGLSTRVRLFGDADDVRTVERWVNRSVLTVLGLGVGLLSVLLLGSTGGPVFAGSDVRLLEVLGWVGLFASTVLVLRVLLAVLRADAADR